MRQMSKHGIVSKKQRENCRAPVNACGNLFRSLDLLLLDNHEPAGRIPHLTS